MTVTTRWITGLLSALLLTGSCWAQAEQAKKEPLKYYQLDFIVKEVESGKPINSRTYSIEVLGGTALGSIRAGDRVPAASTSTEKTYIDVGVSIDVRFPREEDGQLRVEVNADLSNLVGEAAGGLPVIRQTKWHSDVSVHLRRPTLLFSADDATSKRQLQLELTATPIESR